MKKIYLILSVILSFNGLIFSQKAPSFKLTKDGMKQIVVNFDTNFTANVIYTKIKEWIALNNKFPESVTRIDKENSLIKFSCFKKDAWKIRDNNFDYWNEMKYTFAVEIKDYKCRITFDTDEDRYKFWYNDNGTLKDRFKESETSFENTVNETLASLYKYMVTPPKPKKDDW
jgi:hypothetical protein